MTNVHPVPWYSVIAISFLSLPCNFQHKQMNKQNYLTIGEWTYHGNVNKQICDKYFYCSIFLVLPAPLPQVKLSMGQSCCVCGGGGGVVYATKQNTVGGNILSRGNILSLVVDDPLVTCQPCLLVVNMVQIPGMLWSLLALTVGASQVYVPSCGRLKYHTLIPGPWTQCPWAGRILFPSPRFMTSNYSVMKTVITKVSVSMSPLIPRCMALLLEPWSLHTHVRVFCELVCVC